MLVYPPKTLPQNIWYQETAFIIQFHLTLSFLPLHLPPPPSPRPQTLISFDIREQQRQLSRQICYQPSFCHSKKLYKPPESKTDCVWRAGYSFCAGPSWTLSSKRGGSFYKQGSRFAVKISRLLKINALKLGCYILLWIFKRLRGFQECWQCLNSAFLLKPRAVQHSL